MTYTLRVDQMTLAQLELALCRRRSTLLEEMVSHLGVNELAHARCARELARVDRALADLRRAKRE